MAARKALFKEADVIRSAKAMRKAGCSDWRFVAHPDGSQEIVVGKTATALAGPDPDELLK
ncbi:MAG: hypothetical protein Q8O82_10320 [Pseudorhodobacter sp.]|nr:hypothetical protein [Pseudorhodobacter sp.]